MFDIVLLNIIFILIPILCYIIYELYENVLSKKENNIFFTFAIISSIYLITKYSINFNYLISIIKVLFLICLLKNKRLLIVFIYMFLSIYYVIYIDYNSILFLIINTIQIIIVYILLKDYRFEYKILSFYIIESIFELINGFQIPNLLYSNILYGILSYSIILIINRTNDVINIYGTARQIEYEKDFRNSLFKVTHEIKNPIAVCKGYLDMLNVDNHDQVVKYIPIIKGEIDRTLVLMNDFLNLTKLKVEKSVMDISILLDDVFSSISTLLKELNIDFKSDSIDDEIYIEGDYNRLKQVFMNLVKNSVESMQKGYKLINIGYHVTKKYIVITIEDNGSGIDKESLNKIGEPFFTTKSKGTGLGVKLSIEIIEQHNGTIKYISKEGIGTKVIIRLPLYK
ncbi:MAG: HAMP domain-containing histidine kinase [Bacilli bacterium]|nr:HAMP domain-containing histidine kinase [Bacilli bacterium]